VSALHFFGRQRACYRRIKDAAIKEAPSSSGPYPILSRPMSRVRREGCPRGTDRNAKPTS
jgi:hypothetical protein